MQSLIIKVQNNGTFQMDELRDISPDQEEADAKMSYASYNEASSVCTDTVNTDVLVLSLPPNT